MSVPPDDSALTAAEAPESLEQRLRATGEALGNSLREVLERLPGGPHRPNQLSRDLGVNRAVASRVLNAVSKSDPLELLHLVPGPEPLRKLVRAAARRGVPAGMAGAADEAIAAFDLLIRNEAGTRPALDALISSSLPGARERFEVASKYSVYKGLSQLKGVRAEAWVGVAVVLPSEEDPDRLDLTWLNGAVAMQRLRPGVTVRFSYRHRRGEQAAAEEAGPIPPPSVVSLDEFCVHPPARLEARSTGKTVHYTLPDELLGPQEVVDMFVVDHHPSAMRRYAIDAPRRHSSLFVEPAVPVGSLVFDTLLHRDAFPGAEPRLLLYDTGYDGIANVNDPDRDLDRVDLRESVEFLGRDLRSFDAAELPRYRDMLLHLADRFGWDPAEFRGYRTRIRYPVYGWQVCMAFEPPPGPEA